jgi:hypothetical protein
MAARGASPGRAPCGSRAARLHETRRLDTARPPCTNQGRSSYYLILNCHRNRSASETPIPADRRRAHRCHGLARAIWSERNLRAGGPGLAQHSACMYHNIPQHSACWGMLPPMFVGPNILPTPTYLMARTARVASPPTSA